MDQAIQDGAGEALRPDIPGLFLKWQFRRDDDRAEVVTLRDDLEERCGPRL